MPMLDFWFDFASTYSYPAALRVAPLAKDDRPGPSPFEARPAEEDGRAPQGDGYEHHVPHLLTQALSTIVVFQRRRPGGRA